MQNETSNFRKGFEIPFTQIPNSILFSEKLSFKAKALWCYLNSKPKGWSFSADRIALETTDGPKSIRAGIKELIDKGFLKSERQTTGRMLYTLLLPDCHIDLLATEPHCLFVKETKCQTDKMATINKKEINKKRIINKKENVATQNRCDERAYQLAERLHNWLLRNKPDRKIEKDYRQRWGEEIDKMHRIDGREWPDITAAIDWCQRDSFWKTNILSGKKLRQHFDRLQEQSMRDKVNYNETVDIDHI